MEGTVKVKGAKSSVKTAKKADAKNLDNAKVAITKEKNLMYNYPKEVSTLELRKTFRHGVRRTAKSYATKLKKAEKGADRDALVAEANKWAGKTFTEGHVPTYK